MPTSTSARFSACWSPPPHGQDSVAGQTLIGRVAAAHPTIGKTWVEGGYRQHLVEHAPTLALTLA